MVGAVRRVSIGQGIDPRDYTLVAFGGAGPLHAALLLRAVGARAVLIPRYPGLFAAAGLLASDLRVDESQTVLRVFDAAAIVDFVDWFDVAGARMLAQLRGRRPRREQGSSPRERRLPLSWAGLRAERAHRPRHTSLVGRRR